MLKAYFVTEMARLDSAGSALVNAYYSDAYLKEALEKTKKTYPERDWQIVKLGELYDEVVEATNETLIVLGRNAAPYKNALVTKYPRAEILLSDAIKSVID